MSEHEESRRRHGRRGGLGRYATVGGWVVAVLVLGGNLVWGVFKKEGDRPQGFLNLDLVVALLFWGSVAAVAAASAGGIYWAAKAYARREKASLLWTRHAFTFGLVAAVLLVAVRQGKQGQFITAWGAAAIVAVQSSLFAYASFREARRTLGTGSRGRSHDDADSEAP